MHREQKIVTQLSKTYSATQFIFVHDKIILRKIKRHPNAKAKNVKSRGLSDAKTELILNAQTKPQLPFRHLSSFLFQVFSHKW